MPEVFHEKWVNTELFTEFRYKSNQKFFDTKEKIIKELIVEYPNYNIEKLDSIVMHSSNYPGVNLQIMPARFHVNFEDGAKIEDFSHIVQHIWKKVNRYMEITSIDRIGARGYFIQKLDDDKVKAVLNKFLNHELLDNNIDNIQIAFNKIEKEFGVRISTNGSSLQSVSISNNPAHAEIIKGLFMDIDIFKNNILNHDITTFYGYCQNGFKKYLDLFK